MPIIKNKNNVTMAITNEYVDRNNKHYNVSNTVQNH